MLRVHTVFALAVLFASVACGGSSDSAAGDAQSSGSPSGDVTSGDDGTTTDGPVRSGGCAAIKVGPLSGTVVTSVPRAEATTPGVPWQDAKNALATDGAFATAKLAAAAESEELRITGFNFVLPPDNVFQGVEVELKRQAPGEYIVDGQIALIGVPNQVGRGKYIATPWPSSIVGLHHYGQATDTWGMDLNAPDVTRPEFGVSLWVKRGQGATAPTALVESILVSVYYCKK